ncbi:hypothetical protein [Streptococcus dysgalactiae]|uniref:hypothetical protein n=1 Tax=Streptococcus dysgalactiae TaxID=1334 RepID=UPI0013FD20F5|nr:hypothetical protein [Streptococcus dysgalactiae]
MFKFSTNSLQIIPTLQPLFLVLSITAIIMPETFQMVITIFTSYMPVIPFGIMELIFSYKLLTMLYIGAKLIDDILSFNNKMAIPVLYGIWNITTFIVLYHAWTKPEGVFLLFWQSKENLLEVSVILLGFLLFLFDKLETITTLYVNSHNPYKKIITICGSIIAVIFYLIKL